MGGVGVLLAVVGESFFFEVVAGNQVEEEGLFCIDYNSIVSLVMEADLRMACQKQHRVLSERYCLLLMQGGSIYNLGSSMVGCKNKILMPTGRTETSRDIRPPASTKKYNGRSKWRFDLTVVFERLEIRNNPNVPLWS